MFRVAVFIDAGYLWKQLAKALCPQDLKYQRCNVLLDYDTFHSSILKYVEKTFPGIPLLRCYWYDGALSNGKRSSDHDTVARLNDFKLKLGGRIVSNDDGTVGQKGVDGLITADLMGLAQNRVVSHALLLSGDGDLVPGVSVAQELGIRIHLLGIFSEEATSPYLRMETDFFEVWGREDIAAFAKPKQAPAAKISLDSDCDSIDFARALETKITDFYNALEEQDKSAISASYVPPHIDRRLIRLAYEQNKQALTESQKVETRRLLKRLATKS